MTVPPPRVVVKSYKVSKRRDLDISTVSAGMRLERDAQGRVKDIVLAYGGMAAMTRRAKRCEAFLLGKKWSREIVEAAMPILDVDFEPISDARSGAEFRSAAARNLLLKFWWESRARS
jgi:xanthine dehydrogenase iron-sulfur cluster and FAD-binding subunit A